MPLSINNKNRILTAAAIFIGAAVPLLPLGIAFTQGALGLGLILLLVVTNFDSEVRSSYRQLMFNPIAIALTVMFAVWFAVVPWSDAPWVSFTTLARTALYIMGCALIWANMSIHNGLRHKALVVLISLTIVILTIACASLLLPGDVWQAIQSLWGKTATASRHFKAYSSALVCLIPVLIWGGHRIGGNWRWLAWGIMPAILYVMLATESRSSVAGLLIMLSLVSLAYLWANGKLSKIILGGLVLAFTSAMTWVWFIGQRYMEISDSYLPVWLIDPHRQVVWHHVFKMFLEAPWAGHGINRINYIAGADTIRLDVSGVLIPSHPHNWMLEILSETGIIGFGALLVVLALFVWRLLVRYKYKNDMATLALIALSASFFGSSLFNFSIWSSWWLLTFFFLFALVSVDIEAPKIKKVLFVVTEDWFFYSHRIPTAKAAHDAGFDVVVTAREGSQRESIEKMGFRFVPWRIRRKNLNLLFEIQAALDLIRIFDREHPTIAYSVTLKPIIYGAIAAQFARTPHTINLFSGLGDWFVSKKFTLRLIRTLVMPILRIIHASPRAWLMVQNDDDRRVLNSLRIGKPDRTVLVPGSGIDTDVFTPLPEPDGPMTVISVSRMLWSKGFGEVVDAARILKAQGRDIRIVLVGDPDTENSGHVPVKTLKKWTDEGIIEWWGRRENIPAVWAQAHVALLPSYYREGIPKSLMEGGACGRPMIGADTPGCRDLVRDGVNGFLVPPRDSQAIADVLIKLDDDPRLRHRLGQAARKDIEKIYSVDVIGIQIKTLLNEISSPE